MHACRRRRPTWMRARLGAGPPLVSPSYCTDAALSSSEKLSFQLDLYFPSSCGSTPSICPFSSMTEALESSAYARELGVYDP